MASSSFRVSAPEKIGTEAIDSSADWIYGPAFMVRGERGAADLSYLRLVWLLERRD